MLSYAVRNAYNPDYFYPDHFRDIILKAHCDLAILRSQQKNLIIESQ